MITKMDMDEKDRYDVIKFLADTDQFFLNIMMATGKAVMDAARQVTDGTIVTAMCRNGVEFGIRISGMGMNGSPLLSTRPRDSTLQVMTVRTPARIWVTAPSQRPSA